jgi:hypothetical protein
MADQLHRQPPERINPPPVMTNVEFQRTIPPRGTVTDAQPHALPAALNRMVAPGCQNHVRIG